MILVGLADTRKVRKCVFARSGAAAIRVLRKGLAATAADDYGAINAYKDKFGKYRCDAMRWMQIIESKTFTNLPDVRAWYSRWLKKIGELPKVSE